MYRRLESPSCPGGYWAALPQTLLGDQYVHEYDRNDDHRMDCFVCLFCVWLDDSIAA